MRVQPSAGTNATFRGVVLALKATSKEMRKDISKATRDEGNPIWREEIAANTGLSTVHNRIFAKGARISVGNPSKAVAGTSRRPLSGGLKPNEHAAAFEFGAGNRDAYTEYQRKNRDGSGSHTVRRRTKRQLPPARRQGYVVYPAWAEAGPRLVSLWVQTIVRKVHESLEK